MQQDQRKIIGIFESANVKSSNGDTAEVLVKVDTGALRTSIDASLAQKLGLLNPENIVGKAQYRSSLGRRQTRNLIKLSYWLAGLRIDSIANVTDRSHLHFAMIIGRLDLGRFTINYNPETEHEKPDY